MISLSDLPHQRNRCVCKCIDRNRTSPVGCGKCWVRPESKKATVIGLVSHFGLLQNRKGKTTSISVPEQCSHLYWRGNTTQSLLFYSGVFPRTARRPRQLSQLRVKTGRRFTRVLVLKLQLRAGPVGPALLSMATQILDEKNEFTELSRTYPAQAVCSSLLFQFWSTFHLAIG